MFDAFTSPLLTAPGRYHAARRFQPIRLDEHECSLVIRGSPSSIRQSGYESMFGFGALPKFVVCRLFLMRAFGGRGNGLVYVTQEQPVVPAAEEKTAENGAAAKDELKEPPRLPKPSRDAVLTAEAALKVGV